MRNKNRFKKRNRCWYIKFAKKVDLVSLKSETDKLDNGKFRTTPVDLIRLSDAVKNKVIKRTIHDELVKKFNAV